MHTDWTLLCRIVGGMGIGLLVVAQNDVLCDRFLARFGAKFTT
jgi:hypothetical protein